MDYNKPESTVEAMLNAGAAKSQLSISDLLIRGVLSGAILAIATSLALLATVQSGVPFVGALIFPVGFVLIVLSGLELVTGNFALVPVAFLDGKCGWRGMLSNFGWVTLGNLIGAVAYAALFYYAQPQLGLAAGVSDKLVAAAQNKTLGFAALGNRGLLALLCRAVLCNWMVTLGAVMGLTSTSTLGKMAAAWLPITIFFAHGYEHLVVNMFVIPAGMMFGAKVTLRDWMIWNFIPVTVGNFIGGFIFTGLPFYITHRKKAAAAP
jgi:formate/nitrite transporter